MSGATSRRKLSRWTLGEWRESAGKVDAQMRSIGAPALSLEALEELAANLKKIASMAAIGEAWERSPSREATSRELNRLRLAVNRIAFFGKSLPENAAVDQLGQAVSDWRVDGTAEEFEHMFERPIRVSEVFTEYGGTAFVRDWFARAKLISAILRSMPELRSGQAFNMPRQKTETQGHILPNLFAKIYPSLKFGGKNKEEKPVGYGFDFVGLTMVELGYPRPANETIVSACKKMRNRFGR